MSRFVFSLISTLAFTLSFSSAAFADSSLLDVASPDEVAAELGLAPQVSFQRDPSTIVDEGSPRMIPMSLSQHNEMARLDLTQYFPVVVLVNKSNVGPTKQTMKVYHRGVLKYQFDVSTGREQPEVAKSGREYFSTTSTGWYSPTRTYEKYYSQTWLAWMNNSIFFNGGLALHATTSEHFKELGRRASGGCVRLHPKNAKLLWDLVMSEGHGQVPAFTPNGQILRGAFGKITFRQGWNTLIIVEDNPGI